MVDLWSQLPPYAQYLIQGILLSSLMSFSAVVLGKTGRSPYWALLVIVPYVLLPAVWFLAFSDWPAVKKKK